MSKLDRFLTGFAYLIAKHWLTIVNILMLLFIIPPVLLYPFFMHTGNSSLLAIASTIKRAYGPPICDQLADRSIFILGYQMAICSRNLSIFVSFLSGGIIFYFLRNKLKPFSIVYYIILCIPMAIDGFAQLFGIPIPRGISPGGQLIWTILSNNGLRIITGSIFGLGSALFVLPYMQKIFDTEDNQQNISSETR